MANPNVTIDRHKYVGGSDLPNILGYNAKKYGESIFEFAKEKAGIVPKKFKGNEFTKYGQKMEPVIRDYINAKYGVNYLEDTIIDKEKGYRGNTDGLDPNSKFPILEVKTFGTDLDVDYYLPQCQFYMETFNQPRCLLVGYKRPDDFYKGVDYELENSDDYFNFDFDENNIVEYEIERDRAAWIKIEERIIAFKHCVDALKKDQDMSENEFNKLFYGDELITTANEISKLEIGMQTYKNIKNEYDKSKEKLYKLFEEKNILSFTTDNIKITKVEPSSTTKEVVDEKKLKTENKEIYDKYKTTKTTSRKGYVLITLRKGEK